MKRGFDLKNKFIGLFCVLLAVLLLASCGGAGKVAMKYDAKGGGEINQSTMSLLIAVINGQRSEYAPYLNKPIAEGGETTYGDLIVVEATALGEMLLKCEYLNDVVYGFGLSAEQSDSVEKYIDAAVDTYGSKTALADALSKFGADTEALKRFVTLSLKQSTLRQNIFGEGGTNYITDTELISYFADNYIIADHVYLKLSGEAKEDGTATPLTEEQKQEKRDFANALYMQILSGGTTFDKAIEEYGQDTYKMMYPDGYFVPREQESNLEEAVLSALREMTEGDMRVVETASGIYILRKNEMNGQLCMSVPEFAAALEYTMENEKFGEMIEALDGVKLDKDIIGELDPSVIPAFNFSTEGAAE